MVAYIYPFLISLIVSMILTPLARICALKLGAVVQPKSRGVHTKPIPYLGGVAIYLAFVLSVLFSFDYLPRPIMGLIIGGGFVVLLGVLDDRFTLSPKAKLIGQIIAAVIIILFDVRIRFLTNPLSGGMIVIRGFEGIPLTVFWIVAIMNIVNLIDGLDGLAAGITTIAAVTMLFAALQVGYGVIVLLTGALAGSALGFLPYNFNPARIFMGDAGSLFLGYALAVISIEGTLKSAATIALAIPIVTLGLPIFDTAFAIVRRYLNGRPIYEADKGHLHHRLLALGLNQRQTVIIMYLVSGILGLSALFLSKVGGKAGLSVIFIVFLSLFLGAQRVGVLKIHQGRNVKHS